MLIERTASLRFTLLAPARRFSKMIGVLAELAPGLVAAEQHLLLERVAARPHPVESRFAQLAHAVAAVRAAGVLHRHAEQEPHQQFTPCEITLRGSGQFSVPPPSTYREPIITSYLLIPARMPGRYRGGWLKSASMFCR